MTPTIATIDLGDAARVRIAVRSSRDDSLTDAVVSAIATDVTGSVSADSVAHLGQGVYEAEFTLPRSGSWMVRVTVSGDVAGIEYGVVRVRPAP